MNEFENLLLDINSTGILFLTINRPDKMNALNSTTIEEIRTAIQRVYDDSTIRGVVITGAGDKAFIAGADIAELAELNEVNGRKFSEQGQEVFALIENCHKPVIAAVNGFALGGGCELAMACHMRIASQNARFGQPEVNLGIIPGYGGTQRLTQLVGKGKALELIMTGDMLGAEEAKTLGLVNHVVPSREALMEKCLELMNKIIAKGPLAIGMVVDCVNAAYDPKQDGYQVEANSFGSCCRTGDFKEGTRAFLEKRKAKFSGN
ncbi:enoyl-CoA hydratase/isomerase family protein [Cesiribacter sp. SM1]|uniref:enoyl-CoA hydratase/isomerase family protein n=1 Tax=Cesiribacter sp. SM1 TaxID=2861196 RepID=UPI001CD4A791|nr:enoyl-CoA hydratase-related protein [Cesiribacter sp. SM1]